MLIWCPVVNLTRIETPLILFQKVFNNMRADKAHPTVISTFPIVISHHLYVGQNSFYLYFRPSD
ncbi:hypothetical protein DFO78_10610 [Bacillus subtilis]|nr:hypothetical protein DFO78_10610 [Bacillus subtilis]